MPCVAHGSSALGTHAEAGMLGVCRGDSGETCSRRWQAVVLLEVCGRNCIPPSGSTSVGSVGRLDRGALGGDRTAAAATEVTVCRAESGCGSCGHTSSVGRLFSF